MAGSTRSASTPALTISIATWNNRELVAGCLRSLDDGLKGVAAEIFVVDNASNDGTAEMVRSDFPHVRVLRNEDPQGFSANHNQVLRQASGRHVLLLNDDTVVLAGALASAVEFLDSHPDAGAAGCTLVKPDGTPERISQRFPHPLDPIFPQLRRKVLPTGGRESAPSVNGQAGRPDAVEVERLSGACLMVRRAVIDRVGLLDEEFDPVYSEDTDLCYRIRQAGWRIYRLPHARVIHYRGRTAKREWADQARRLQAAKFRWYRKHRSRPALWLYRTAVIVAALAQIAAGLPSLLVGHRRAETRDRMRRRWARIRAALGLA